MQSVLQIFHVSVLQIFFSENLGAGYSSGATLTSELKLILPDIL